MGSLDQARDTQLKNIEAKTGKSLDQLRTLLTGSGLAKHGELRSFAMEKLGLGYGDANTLVHLALASDGQSAAAGQSDEDVLAGIYADKKAPLRPIHDALMAAIGRFGEFEIAPKKGYVSLRRKKQFAMIGPGSTTRVDVGLNMKDVPATDRLLAEKPGGMCQYKVKLAAASGGGRGTRRLDPAGLRRRRLSRQPLVQRARAREVREQVLHLVGEHAPALEVDVLGVARRERDGDQLQLRLLGRAPGLEVVAAAAGGDHVVPGIAPAARQRRDVIARQLATKSAARSTCTGARRGGTASRC